VGSGCGREGAPRAGAGCVRTAWAGPLEEPVSVFAGGFGANGAERGALMTFRKLAAYVPLAMLVGAILHVAATGFEHAPDSEG
jgi:hypothetical protein